MPNEINAVDIDQLGQNIQVIEPSNNVIITLEGRDIRIPMENLGVGMESTENQIIDAVRPVIQEEHGVDIADEQGQIAYTVRKAMNSNTIYVYPKPVMG